MGQQILSVTELNEQVKRCLDREPSFQNVYVRGEISNYKRHSNGYCYFNLKDPGGVVNCVMSARSLGRFEPENGMKVTLQGRVSLYAKSGIYQLFARMMTPEGIGELTVAFRQLTDKLNAEGLFRPEHKKPLPRFPERIALITASSGDAVHDMIRILGRRYPLAKVLVMSVRVQGARAPLEIEGAIRYANKWRVADLIITGRGGGSMEDLWAFNSERVARAIYESEIPVISAVGHEPDVTVADFVADVRASTPSNAAERAVPEKRELLRWLWSTREWLANRELNRLDHLRRRLEAQTSKRVLRDQLAYVQDKQMELFHLQRRMGELLEAQLTRKRTRFAALSAALDAMSPLKVFARGYAMVQDEEGRILRSWQDTAPGAKIRVTLGTGGFTGTVDTLYEKESAHGNEHDI